MNTLTFPTHEELSQKVAELVFESIQKKLGEQGTFILGMATGASPKRMYSVLVELLGSSKLDLSRLHTFNLDEYYPIKQSHPKSYFQEMYTRFWKPLHEKNPTFEIPNGHILSGECGNPNLECRIYEHMIKSLGGIDLQILGLGTNGHIGFNEPGSPADSRTHVIDLAIESREANKIYFDGDLDKVPAQGLTMGIETILEAKEVILMVTGNGKEDVFDKLTHLSSPTSKIPASFLLNHPCARIFTDIPKL